VTRGENDSVALRTFALWTSANGETIPQNQYLSSKTDLETPRLPDCQRRRSSFPECSEPRTAEGQNDTPPPQYVP